MASDHDYDIMIAGGAALSIGESILVALSDLKILTPEQARGVLQDAADSHRTAMPHSAMAAEHQQIADLIERIMDGKNSVRRF